MAGSGKPVVRRARTVIYRISCRWVTLERMDLSALLMMMLPFLLGIGGVAAWRASKRTEEQDRERAAAWRDDSLDDWRKERERMAEEERARRATAETETHTGSTREGDEKKQHQRIGG